MNSAAHARRRMPCGRAARRSRCRPRTARITLKTADVAQISGDILGQIYARDFKMIDQSQMIVSLVPETARAASPPSPAASSASSTTPSRAAKRSTSSGPAARRPSRSSPKPPPGFLPMSPKRSTGSGKGTTFRSPPKPPASGSRESCSPHDLTHPQRHRLLFIEPGCRASLPVGCRRPRPRDRRSRLAAGLRRQ